MRLKPIPSSHRRTTHRLGGAPEAPGSLDFPGLELRDGTKGIKGYNLPEGFALRTVGYIRDGKGRRVLALVPVSQLGSMVTGRSGLLAPPLNDEQAALDRLFTCPSACLETRTEVNPIRSAREAAGLTQADLALAMRISQPMLSRQEQPFRRLRPATIKRALAAIQRIQENQNRPAVSLDSVLSRYGARLEASAARKPRDPVERRLLREAGDSVALLESDANVREAGERRRPLQRKAK